MIASVSWKECSSIPKENLVQVLSFVIQPVNITSQKAYNSMLQHT